MRAVSNVRVGVFGAGGRMGSTVCRAVAEDASTDLVAAVDPHYAGVELSRVSGIKESDVVVSPHAEAFVEAGVDVAIDFTEIDAARDNLAWLAEHKIHAVVGTSGFTESDVTTFRSAFTESNCLIAPNFAIGAILMMRFAEMAAPHFETAEIIEFHHDAKIDSPSGTAMATVERMSAASDQWASDSTTTRVLEGARGGEGPGGIRVHSVRMRGMVAHQEVVLGTAGQTLTIRHDSIDRTSFMPGVLLATRRISDLPGVTLGLEILLGL